MKDRCMLMDTILVFVISTVIALIVPNAMGAKIENIIISAMIALAVGVAVSVSFVIICKKLQCDGMEE